MLKNATVTPTVVMRQVEQDSNNGPHTVLHCLPHHSSVWVQLPAVTLDHLLTPAQRSEGRDGDFGEFDENQRKQNLCTRDVWRQHSWIKVKKENLYSIFLTATVSTTCLYASSANTEIFRHTTRWRFMDQNVNKYGSTTTDSVWELLFLLHFSHLLFPVESPTLS